MGLVPKLNCNTRKTWTFLRKRLVSSALCLLYISWLWDRGKKGIVHHDSTLVSLSLSVSRFLIKKQFISDLSNIDRNQNQTFWAKVKAVCHNSDSMHWKETGTVSSPSLSARRPLVWMIMRICVLAELQPYCLQLSPPRRAGTPSGPGSARCDVSSSPVLHRIAVLCFRTPQVLVNSFRAPV